MSTMLTLGQALTANASLYPDKIGARDSVRQLSYRKWNERACRLANALLGLGLAMGDRVGILAFNCIEWMEIYAATAKAGLVAVPVNFRLLGAEVRYIVEDAQAMAVIVQDGLLDRVEELRADPASGVAHYIHFGAEPAPTGFRAYEALIDAAAAAEPEVIVRPEDPWALMYTSGTTGKPKGAIRSHGASVLLVLVTALDQSFSSRDTGLLVMPLCHSNSMWYATLLAYCGATTIVYDRHNIEPEHLLASLAESGLTFTSLVPTHYIMMLGLPEAVRARYRGNSVNKLLVSSAPARRDTKLAILEQFPASRLFEGYGSTEAGWVTLLRPEEQLERIGSIGRELTGSGRIRLLGADGQEVPDGEVGELYSLTPYAFNGYWKLPHKTAEALRDGYCSVGDMARRAEGGFYYLADRKTNMIISGGENIYPVEIENLLGDHPKIKDVAVIGVPDQKWGEAVHAVIVLHDGVSATEGEIVGWCHERIAGYKAPKSVSFIAEADMPRTATGKLLHRVLRERYAPAESPSAVA